MYILSKKKKNNLVYEKDATMKPLSQKHQASLSHSPQPLQHQSQQYAMVQA
jgi:hypothetical protein